MNEPCRTWRRHVTYKWVMSHMNESCHIWMWQLRLAHATSDDSFMYEMAHSYVTWFIYMWHDSFIWDMTHSYIHPRQTHATSDDSFICDMAHSDETWLIYMWHDSFIRDMTHSYVQPRLAHPTSLVRSTKVVSFYGVATMSRMLKNIRLFAEYRSLL